MKKTFTVAVFQEENWFVAKCIENSITSQGLSPDEALANLREALNLLYEGEIIPELTPLQLPVTEIERGSLRGIFTDGKISSYAFMERKKLEKELEDGRCH